MQLIKVAGHLPFYCLLQMYVMNIMIGNMNTINEAYLDTQSYGLAHVDCIFVQYFAFLTSLSVGWCATTTKFCTDILD